MRYESSIDEIKKIQSEQNKRSGLPRKNRWAGRNVRKYLKQDPGWTTNMYNIYEAADKSVCTIECNLEEVTESKLVSIDSKKFKEDRITEFWVLKKLEEAEAIEEKPIEEKPITEIKVK